KHFNTLLNLRVIVFDFRLIAGVAKIPRWKLDTRYNFSARGSPSGDPKPEGLDFRNGLRKADSWPVASREVLKTSNLSANLDHSRTTLRNDFANRRTGLGNWNVRIRFHTRE